MGTVKRSTLCAMYDLTMEAEKWVQEIPYINFSSDWQVRIIPPMGGAVVRFIVSYKAKEVSVYLDCYRALGSTSIPYWEAYPINDDTYRCAMDDVDSLIKVIKEELES